MRVTNELDKEIGQRLRQARLVENLTQGGLAQKLNISFQQLQKYESGSNRVSSSRLWTISRVLGLPITYFFNGLEEVSNSDGVAHVALNDDAMSDRIVRTARQINEIPEGPVLDCFLKLGRSLAQNTTDQ